MRFDHRGKFDIGRLNVIFEVFSIKTSAQSTVYVDVYTVTMFLQN